MVQSIFTHFPFRLSCQHEKHTYTLANVPFALWFSRCIWFDWHLLYIYILYIFPLTPFPSNMNDLALPTSPCVEGWIIFQYSNLCSFNRLQRRASSTSKLQRRASSTSKLQLPGIFNYHSPGMSFLTKLMPSKIETIPESKSVKWNVDLSNDSPIIPSWKCQGMSDIRGIVSTQNHLGFPELAH